MGRPVGRRQAKPAPSKTGRLVRAGYNGITSRTDR
jgi:hypothetical protein